MAATLRLPDDLLARSNDYAKALGISLNALVAVSLTEYLRTRTISPKLPLKVVLSGPSPSSAKASKHSAAPASPKVSRAERRRLQREAKKGR